MASKSLLLALLSAAFVTADNAANTPRSATARPVCTEENWSRASAFWFLFTFAIACLAHPRGSLLFHRAGRVWRLSPLYLLIEDLVIVTRLISGIRRNGWRTWRTTLRLYAYVSLALREGNVWDQAEWNCFFGNEENARYLNCAREVMVLPPGVTGVDSGDVGIPLVPLARRTTSMLEEGREFGGPDIGARISMDLWFVIEELALANEDIAPWKGVLNQLLDAHYRRSLDIIQEYEKGPTYRTLLWLPIIQQFCKSCLVKGAPMTQILGYTFMASFFLVELLLLAARSPLEEPEAEKALELMRVWGKMERILPKVRTDSDVRKSHAWLKQNSLSIIASISDFVAIIVNWILFILVNDYKGLLLWAYSGWHQSLDDIGWFWYVVGMQWILSFILWFFVFCLMSIGLSFYLASAVGRCVEFFGGNPRPWEDEWTRFLPAFSAAWSVVLAIIMYFGLGAEGGLAYECSTTWKSSAYDLLG